MKNIVPTLYILKTRMMTDTNWQQRHTHKTILLQKFYSCIKTEPPKDYHWFRTVWEEIIVILLVKIDSVRIIVKKQQKYNLRMNVKLFISFTDGWNFTHLHFIISRLTTHSKNSWHKGEVRENLGDFRKAIKILTFLSPLPHVLYLSQNKSAAHRS